MRLSLLLLVLLLSTACGKTVEQTKAPVKKSLFSVYEKEVKNLEVQELENEIVLKWELEDKEKIKNVIVELRGSTGEIKKIKLAPEIEEYRFASNPMDKMKIKVKLYAKDGGLSKGKKLRAKSKMALIIRDQSDFIDLNSNEVKLLFKATEGSTVNVYFGENKEELKIVESYENYKLDIRVKIDGLEAGKEYFYKIEAIKDEKKIETEIMKIVKEDIRENFKRAEWAKDAIFYEIFVRSFCDGDGDGIGDFQGIAEKMSYLKDLGVDALWLMPTFDSPSYHGYDVVDYYATEPDYGTMEDFENMIKVAHEYDIKIVVDFIINHSSYDHPWFQDAMKSKESKYRRYYHFADEFDKFNEAGPWGQNIWYEDGKENYEAIFWSRMPDMNFASNELRDEMKKAAKFWIEKGVDGFRLDAAKHIDDKDKELTHAWWKEFQDTVKSESEDLFIVGENWDSDPNIIAPFFKEMDSSFNFGLSYQIIDILRNGKGVNLVEELNKVRELYGEYEKDFIDSTFLRNHDMSRVASEADGVGQQRLGAAILMTLPGTPFLYYGEEFGQKGNKPDENIREPMDWYKSMEGKGMTIMSNKNPFGYTIANDGISYEEQKDDENSMYNYYKKLIKIRKENKFMFNGKYVSVKADGGIQAYDIFDPENESVKLRVIHNIKNEMNSFVLENTEYTNEAVLLGNKESNELKLEAYETVIIKYTK